MVPPLLEPEARQRSRRSAEAGPTHRGPEVRPPARGAGYGRPDFVVLGLRVKMAGFRVLDLYRNAVRAMCKSCCPDGGCWDHTCALRPVSPLPLSRKARANLVASGRTSDNSEPVFDPPDGPVERVF